MAKALTTKSVENVKPDPAKRLELPDAALTGLYLVVQPSGAKSWALRYRHAGKPKKLTLGKWPVMGLADARAAASEAIEAVEHGCDPSAQKKATKAAKRNAELSERDKVKTLIDQFDKRHLSGLKSGDHARQFLIRFVIPAWGDRNIHDITRRDVLDLLDRIADSGRLTTANRVLAHVRKFFNWCVERDVIQTAATNGVKPVAREASRDRVLTDDEIRWLWQACTQLRQPWGPMGQMLLLTGQRLNEVARMTRGEVQADLWRLAASRTKNGRSHDVPLSRAAQDVLAGVERVENNAGYIFTTNARTPVSGFHKGREHIARQMEAFAAEERGEPVQIPKWGFHDLRRTAATGMARLGIPVRVTEAVLNHVSGTGGGIVAVYQRHDYADEKRAALEAWARFVLQLVEGKVDNIVSINEAKR
ncbi:site-specific integrase [Paracoccus sp. SY]|uniref:tyrosine-type recombinase/integrase n=1 Tax=Paracoccus sp. SY TaxID=1330255 RepID=UPI000CD0BB47|nr:site-specific integrase [Paracoccus sp. SY]